MSSLYAKKTGAIYFLIFSIFALMSTGLCAQENKIPGLWEVQLVEAGGQQMTPIAKWARIHADGTHETGNGWLQNAAGTWEYDAEAQTIHPKVDGGIIDEFGPFKVWFEGETMKWQREEQGMEVTVTWQSIVSLPKAPADQVVGGWDLQEVKKNGTDITRAYDPDDQYFIFIRWDRYYNELSTEGNRGSGYWHMNAHRPHLTLMSHERGKEPQSWEVQFLNDILVLKGISDSNSDLQLSFRKTNKLPW